MVVKQDNPHDSLFRQIMSDPVAAAGELRAVLPGWLVVMIDWDAMELAPGRYVLPDLRNRDSDVLFRTKLAGREGFVHLLLEHQSVPDKHMPLRVLDTWCGADDLYGLFSYISKVSETSARDLGRVVDQLGPLAKEVAVTTAEQLRAEGQSRGQTRTLLRQLSLKFGPLPGAVVEQVEAGGPAELEVWTERVLTANSLEELFGAG